MLGTISAFAFRHRETKKNLCRGDRKEETNKVLHVELSFVWCWNSDISESNLKIPGKCVEMWCWGWIQKISWTDRVRNEEVLQRVKEKRNILYTVKRRKANWIGYILLRNCLLKHIIEGKIKWKKEVMGRWVRWCKQLLDDLKEKIGYWKLKEKYLSVHCGELAVEQVMGPVTRQTIECMNGCFFFLRCVIPVVLVQ